MKKHAYTLIAMIVLVGSMAVAAQAQTSGRTQLTANIPFDFKVGDKSLPAGEYTVTQINPVSDHAVLQLRSRDGRDSVMVQMTGMIGKSQESARLIFNRYGNRCYFAEAWIGDEGLQAPKSHAQRAAQRELAGINAKAEEIALRASR